MSHSSVGSQTSEGIPTTNANRRASKLRIANLWNWEGGGRSTWGTMAPAKTSFRTNGAEILCPQLCKPHGVLLCSYPWRARQPDAAPYGQQGIGSTGPSLQDTALDREVFDKPSQQVSPWIFNKLRGTCAACAWCDLATLLRMNRHGNTEHWLLNIPFLKRVKPVKPQIVWISASPAPCYCMPTLNQNHCATVPSSTDRRSILHRQLSGGRSSSEVQKAEQHPVEHEELWSQVFPVCQGLTPQC